MWHFNSLTWWLFFFSRGSTNRNLLFKEVINCHHLNHDNWFQGQSRINSPHVIKSHLWPLLLMINYWVPACLAIIPHQSLKAFDYNKQLAVTSLEQITLIQTHVALAGHDWVISHTATLLIKVINVSASTPRQRSS